MDKSVMTQAMKASISEVLEQMFFMPIDFFEPDNAGGDQQEGKEMVAAKLAFNGVPDGTFILFMPLALARSVTADFLGALPQNLSGDEVSGTLLEMTNMLAGSTLSNYDHQAIFDLRIPELIPPPDALALNADTPEQISIGIQTLKSRMTFRLVIE